MCGVGDQDDFRGIQPWPSDLAENAVRIEDGLTFECAILRSLVDQHSVPERIQIHTHDFRDQGTFLDARRGFANVAQPSILLRERLEALQTQIGDTQLGAQIRIARAQLIAIGETRCHPIPRLAGRLHDQMQRMKRTRHP